MSHHETNIRKTKAVSIRRNYRSRPHGSRRNYVNQDSEDPPVSHSPPRSKSACARFCAGFQKILPEEPQTVRHIRICVQCLPCASNRRRGTSRKRVKYRRPKSKRQLELQKVGPGKLVTSNESYLRIPPLVEENVVANSSSGDYESTTETKTWEWPIKSSVSGISCVDLEPPGETLYGRTESTPFFPPPTPFQDRYIPTPHSLPRIPAVVQPPRPGFRSFIDLCPRRISSISSFDLNQISRPHMSSKKSRFPPSDIRRPGEEPVVPNICENTFRIRGLSAMKPQRVHSKPFTLIRTSDMPCTGIRKPTGLLTEETKRSPDGNQERKLKTVHFEYFPIKKSTTVPFEPNLPIDVKSKSMSNELIPTAVSLKKSMTDLIKNQLGKLQKVKSNATKYNAIVSKWGKVNSLYIPLGDSPPTLKGPSMPKLKVKKTFDWKTIEMRHLRAELSKSKILEARKKSCRLKQKQWEQQRLIGLCKTRLEAEKCVANIEIKGTLESRFHHIHSFDRVNDKIKVGRYFDMEENRLVAIKIYGHIFTNNISERLQSKLSALSEISALMKMTNCCNIVQMLTYFELDGRLHLILDCCDHTLRDEIEKAKKGIPPEMARRIIQQILNAVAYCHFQKCLHRDISPENLLVASDGTIKLADFDKSVFINTEQARLDISPGTITYGAPELLMKRANYGLSADIWSVGCVIAELLKGSPLWDYSTPEEQLLHIQNSFSPSFPEYPAMVKCSEIIQRGPGKALKEMLPSIAEDAMSLILKCLNIEPHKRSTCSELLQHPFLTLAPNTDEAGAKLEWNSWSAASLATASLIYRPHSALTTAGYDESAVEDYDHESYIMSCLSDVTGSTSDRTSSAPYQFDPKSNVRLRQTPGFTTSQHEESDAKSKPKKKRARKKCKDGEDGRKNPLDKQSDMETEVGSYQAAGRGSQSGRANLPPRPRAANRQVSFESTIRRAKNSRDKTQLPRKFDSNSIQVKKTSLTNLTLPKLSSSQMCAFTRDPVNSPRSDFPMTSKEIMKHIIDTIPSVTGESCDEICSHLNKLVHTSPKLFQNHLNLLVLALLQQISIPKTKVVSPSMKILETLYELSPKGLNETAEKIMDGVLNKVGGMTFIDTACCRILTKIVDNVEPHRFCWHMAKIGPQHRMGMGRAVAAKFLCDGIRRLNVDVDLGDATAAQRRFTNVIFDAATKFTRDSHVPTREYSKELYCLLVQHGDFWRLYLNLVPELERSRVNRILDEIRRVGIGSKTRALT